MSDASLSLEDYEIAVRDLVRSMERFRSASTTLTEVGEALTIAANQFTDAHQRVERLADQASEVLQRLEQFNLETLHVAVKENSSILIQALAKHQQAVAEWRGAWESAHHALETQQAQRFRNLDQRLVPMSDELKNLTGSLNEIQQAQTMHHEVVATGLASVTQQLQDILTRIEDTRAKLQAIQQTAECAASASTQAAQNVVGMTQAMIDEIGVPLSKRLGRMGSIGIPLLIINAILSAAILVLTLHG